MPSLNEKIADSLEHLREVGGDDVSILRSTALTRTHLERLVKHNYLAQIVPGWVMIVDPSADQGESTPYYANFWRFLALYCGDRFGEEWVVDAATSLRLNSGENSVPPQVMVTTPKGNNRVQKFPFNTSLFSFRGNVPQHEVHDGIRRLPLGEALAKVSPAFFSAQKTVALAALASLGSPSEVIGPLIRGGHSVIAGRLAAAFRSIGRGNVADEIVATMTAAGHRVTEDENPLQGVPAGLAFPRRVSPVAARITAMWATMRDGVLAEFDQAAPGVSDTAAYLAEIDERYTADAYHSLSIEGYQVTPQLIEKIRSGQWQPEMTEDDRSQRNALAAKGYDECFRSVRSAVADVLAGADAAKIVRDRHMRWFREMFQPSITAGLFGPERLAGYRTHFIFLKGSPYVPVAHASVQDAMDAFFDCLERDEDPRVRAVLGHFIFTYIHPLPDGNGRLGRFIMNTMLASGGFPWTVVPVDERSRYMEALDAASIRNDIGPFATLIADLVRREPPPPRRRAAGEEPTYRDDAPQFSNR
jgi:hypothetical protein